MAFAEKLLWVLPPIEVGSRYVKRYHVSADPAGIDPEIEKAAYAILPELLPEPDGTPPRRPRDPAGVSRSPRRDVRYRTRPRPASERAVVLGERLVVVRPVDPGTQRVG